MGVETTARTPARRCTSSAGLPTKIGLSSTSSTTTRSRRSRAVPHDPWPAETLFQKSSHHSGKPRWATIRKSDDAGSMSWMLPKSAPEISIAASTTSRSTGSSFDGSARNNDPSRCSRATEAAASSRSRAMVICRRDSCQQLARRERFDQVVVRPRLKPLRRRLLACTRRQHDDRHGAQRRIRPDGAQQTEAVQPRHHHVRKDQGRALATHRRERRLSVGNRLDAPVCFEQARHVLAHVRVVVGEDDARALDRLGRDGRHTGHVSPSTVRIRRQPAKCLFDVRSGPGHGSRQGPLQGDPIRRQVPRACGDPHLEGGSLALAAFSMNLATMELDELRALGPSRCRYPRACAPWRRARGGIARANAGARRQGHPYPYRVPRARRLTHGRTARRLPLPPR